MTQGIDVTKLTLMLNELRLPTIKQLWPTFAERSDKEGWPAARFLSAITEHEIAERGRRRMERHLAEAKLLPGKTLDTFDFDAVPMISKAQVMAICAGDSWLEKWRKSDPVRPARRRKIASVVGHRARADRKGLAGAVRPHLRPRPETTGRAPRARARERDQSA